LVPAFASLRNFPRHQLRSCRKIAFRQRGPFSRNVIWHIHLLTSESVQVIQAIDTKYSEIFLPIPFPLSISSQLIHRANVFNVGEAAKGGLQTFLLRIR
jgi:hypothetical protein